MSLASNIVKRPVLALVVFALISIVALFLVSDVPIDKFPEFSPAYFVVVTSYPGAAPETIERSVTRILESQLVNISGLQEIRSISSEGLSQIILEFKFGTAIDVKTNEVRDRIDRSKSMLPDGVNTPFIRQIDLNARPIIRIAVQGNRNVNELQEIADNIVLDRLEQVDGVASCSIVGGVEQQVRVEISHNRLEAYGLTISGVAGMLANQKLELGAGSIIDGSKNYNIRTTGEYHSVQDIAETVIARLRGADIRLIDIAEVKLGFPKEISSAFINGEPGIFVAVTKQSGTNSAAVADRVFAKLDEIRPLLPPDINLVVIQDRTAEIRNMINELINSALLGAALAMVILFLFLRNIKSTVIIGISIPFSILVTLLMMNLTGITLNLLTMAGLILGIGMVVDCSIVVLENIYKYRERGAKPDVAAILGSQEVIKTIISAIVTTLCVFIPLILFKNNLGLIGIMIQDLIITVGISLSSSLFVAIFLVPVLASKYLVIHTRVQKPLRNRALIKIDTIIENGIQQLTNIYKHILTIAVNNRLLTVIIVIAAFIGSILCLTKMQVDMMPDMDDGSFSFNVELPPGTIYDDTKAVMLQLEDIVYNEINGVKNVVIEIEQSKGTLSVTLDLDLKERDSTEQAKNRLRARFNDFPNAAFGFDIGTIAGMLGGYDIDLVLGINDISAGFETAVEIKSLIAEKVPELIEVSIDMTEGLPQVEVVIDRKRAYNLGLSVSAVAREIAAAMNGVTATTFRSENNEYPVVLELRNEDREKLPDLGRIFTASNTGNLIPLSNFAELKKGAGPVNINRQNQTRVIHITGTLADSNSSAGEVEKKIRNILDSEYIIPDGLSLHYEGQSKETGETLKTFILIIILAILLVFGTMAGLYESFKDPFINLFTMPLLLIGVAAIYVVTGQTINMFTMIGIVMLTGIVVNNGIILVDYTNLLVRRGAAVRDACIESGESRLRPVLMTSLTTILGLVPMAFFFPGDSASYIQPIGLTVIGGLLSSTFITLFFIPVLYSLINQKKENTASSNNIFKENVNAN